MEMYKSTEALDTVDRVMIKSKPPKKKFFFLVTILLCMLGIGALTATAALLLTRDNESNSECDENRRVQNQKARKLYKKIKNKYFELHPEPFLKKNNGGLTIHPLYLNFTPALYKARTRTAKELLQELETVEKRIALSTEEVQTFELFRRFVLDTFGTPYENNYEIGDWLLGPNIFCWQESCMLLRTLFSALQKVNPKTVQDVELMVDLMKKCSEGYKQRIRNLKYGISSGIVLPDVACRAGLQNFKMVHVHVAKNGAKGIFKELNIDLFTNTIKSFTEEEQLKWTKKYNVSVERFLSDSMLKYVGRSLNEFLRYLEDDYSTHCPPSNISSGFASLPLPYVYSNGVADHSKPTNGTLPDGEKFNGSSAYLILLSHFTTYNITPTEVDQIADRRLKELFPQVVKIAKVRTREENETEAIKKFRAELASGEFYYEVENEHHYSEPYLECYNNETAQKHCPGRWKAMNQWLESAKKHTNRLKENVESAFYVSGEKRIMPVCGLTIGFDFHPANPYHSYQEATGNCLNPAKIYIPFFLNKPGPKYEEVTVMAHETYPGHHLEVEGVKEHFQTKCDALRKWVSTKNYFAAFSEGWATYIEKDVAGHDMNLYKNDIERYGMFKHQILAALRAKVDVGVHFLGMKRRDAVSLYEKYVLDSGDYIQKEITRLQSGPGQGTAYMVGEVKFSEYRTKVKDKLGEKFDVRDFHYEVLRQGELPMMCLGKQIDDYIEQELNKD